MGKNLMVAYSNKNDALIVALRDIIIKLIYLIYI